MKRCYIIYSTYSAFFIFILFSISLYGQKTPVTNEKILSNLLVSPVLTHLSDSLNKTDNLLFNSNLKTSFSTWIQQILSDSCLQRNYLVYSMPKSDSLSLTRVIISNPTSQIIYRDAGRKWLFFNKGIYRNIQADFHLQVIDKNNRLLLSKTIAGQYEDKIKHKDIQQIENPENLFSKGTKSGSKFIKRWLDPLVISAATMTMVYLFYTARSN